MTHEDLELPDWWGNPTSADTEKIDEERHRKLLLILRDQSDWEIVDEKHADPDSVVNGGTGIFVGRG